MKAITSVWLAAYASAFHGISRPNCRRSSSSSIFGVNSGGVSTTQKVNVGELVGSGSYGTVHLLTLTEEAKDKIFIGKRARKQEELVDADDSKERATRCQYYWKVEDHCFSKLSPHPQLPPYYGTQDDWLVFGLVGDENTGTPSPTLGDLMKLDCDHPQDLKHIGDALGCSSYEETLDKTLESLLEVLAHVHKHKIVHRDVKPGNLLVHDGTLLLMDFGSAADLEPLKGIMIPRRRGLENGNRVAVSPIYCAPEVFIELNNHPTAFDIFSSGLLFCQLLFSYLEERIDAGFHQQLQETDYDLNLWLSNELGVNLLPSGLDHSLEYLAERPGLWTLLEKMLSEDPSKRPTAPQALKRLRQILNRDEDLEDGPFFTMVIESMETCEIPTVSRPLHFVATFERSQSLGLVLSEMDDDYEGVSDEDAFLWKEATKDASPGEVFVKQIIAEGQADELGIFEVGDRLQGIGELAFTGGGFEKALEMVRDESYSSLERGIYLTMCLSFSSMTSPDEPRMLNYTLIVRVSVIMKQS